jgi:hypothetical protein
VKNLNNKNPESYKPQTEKTAVNEQVKETKTLVATLGIDIEAQMETKNRDKVQEKFMDVLNGKIKSKSELEAKGYKKVNLISTKDGFSLNKVLDKNKEIKWHETSIPTYVHNSLDNKVIIGPYEDDGIPEDDTNKKFALYIKE